MKIISVLAGFVLMIAYCVISTSNIAQAEEVLGTGRVFALIMISLHFQNASPR